MKHFAAPAFIEALAARTETPVMMIQTDGFGASSLRYMEISVPDDVRDELHESDLAFLTFESALEATTKFEEIIANFPDTHSTCLSITIVLGLPDAPAKHFQQIPGYERTFKIAA